MPKAKKLAAIHPGRLLAEDLLDIGVSVSHAARALRVPVNRITEIVSGKRGITADTALRLARYFGTSAQYWLNLQTRYDLQVAQDAAGERIEREVLPAA